MTAHKETSGPAFQTKGPVMSSDVQGMSLRDYFAARAMQGWLTTYADDVASSDVRSSPVAEFAYRIADAMLKARAE